MADVDRRAVQHQRTFDVFDRAIDAGTETTGIGEQYLHGEDYTLAPATWRQRLNYLLINTIT
jgi:hypothetical protein